MRILISILKRNIKKKLQKIRISMRGEKKVFIIGLNKTGTTTLTQCMSDLGYIVGNQTDGEKCLDDIINNNYTTLFDLCKTAEAFQDIPFSIPEVYKKLDNKFPESKFILSIRNDADQWFNSLVNYHSKLWGNKGEIPTRTNLENANYLYTGFALKAMKFIFGDELYNKKICVNIYSKHIQDVIKYFEGRENVLLVLNVEDPNSYKLMLEFLNKTSVKTRFPWVNKTSELVHL